MLRRLHPYTYVILINPTSTLCFGIIPNNLLKYWVGRYKWSPKSPALKMDARRLRIEIPLIRTFTWSVNTRFQVQGNEMYQGQLWRVSDLKEVRSESASPQSQFRATRCPVRATLIREPRRTWVGVDVDGGGEGWTLEKCSAVTFWILNE